MDTSNIVGTGSYSKVEKSGINVIKKISRNYFDSAIREIIALSNCDHPNIVKIVNFNLDNEAHITLKRHEYNLHEYIKDYIVPIPHLYKLTYELFSALDYIHNMGIIHCDIKPANILIDIVDNEPILTICDFGICVPISERYHYSKTQTVYYRAPEINIERYLCQFKPTVDIWSAAIVMLILTSANIQFTHKNDDSSVTACQILGLAQCTSRADRMILLRAVNYNYIIRHLQKIIKNNFDDLKRSGYIHLLANCLQPSPKKRWSASESMSAISSIYNVLYSNIPQRDNLPIAENFVEGLIETDKYPALSIETVNFAYSVYKLFPGDIDDLYKRAIIYIAISVYSGSRKSAGGILGKYSIDDILTAVKKIMIETHGKLSLMLTVN